MKLQVDDWQFIAATTLGSVLAVDLFLGNGQQARLEVLPLFYTDPTGEQIPEIIVSCEMPGEQLRQLPEMKRWLSRPPDKSCVWSQVDLSPALIRQINDQLAGAGEQPRLNQGHDASGFSWAASVLPSPSNGAVPHRRTFPPAFTSGQHQPPPST